mgnify:CR=1 FL=1
MKNEKKATQHQPEIKKVRKLYYKIGEVCEIVDLPHHVIRFWEKEFPQLSPRKTSTGHRIFSEKDIHTINLIKELLYNKKFTIKGAKEFITNKGKEEDTQEQQSEKSEKILNYKSVLEKLKHLKKLLDRIPPH